MTLDNDQIDVQMFNKFITILYMYMFRAIYCTCSGGQIVLIQQTGIVTLSKWPSGGQFEKAFSNCAPDDPLPRVTIPDAVLIQFDLLRMSNILLETCICRGS